MIARLRSFLSQPGRDGIPRTLFITTHQADLARPLATSVLYLTAGVLTETPSSQLGAPHSNTQPANPA
jgi:ABC-type histidine transport system ATPase subunit